MQADATKFQVFFLKFKKRGCSLRDIETTPETENASIWNYFGVGINNKSKYDERTMFPVSLQNYDLYLSPQRTDTSDLSFSASV